jgi:MFS family permease
MAEEAARVALTEERSPVPGVSRNVWWMGVTSFLTDISSEMLYPLIPIFITVTLGAPALAVGVIEGTAEATASFVKLLSGWLSDRLGRRKALVMGGYALSAAAKPLLALAGTWSLVLFARIVDRFGKGIRTSARDALLADSTPQETRGRAFGFHRSADTLGAVLGPLLAIPLLAVAHERLRTIFILSVIPAGLGLAALWSIRDRPAPPRGVELPRLSWGALNAPLRHYILAMLVFALGNSSDAFIILRGRQLGLSLVAVILAYAAYNLIYSVTSLPAGIVSDRIGRRRMIVGGLGFFAAVYLGFALARTPWQMWALLPLYGLYMGLTDGLIRAYAADLSAPEVRGTALGWMNMVTGAGALVASLAAGALWTSIGPAAPFVYGALLAACAALLLTVSGSRCGLPAEERSP